MQLCKSMSWYFYRCAVPTVRKSGVTHFRKGVVHNMGVRVAHATLQVYMSWYFYRCAAPTVRKDDDGGGNDDGDDEDDVEDDVDDDVDDHDDMMMMTQVMMMMMMMMKTQTDSVGSDEDYGHEHGGPGI